MKIRFIEKRSLSKKECFEKRTLIEKEYLSKKEPYWNIFLIKSNMYKIFILTDEEIE